MGDANAINASPMLPSGRGVELLRLLAQGLPLDSVARRVINTGRTVRRRTRPICNRLGFDAPIQAVVWAAQRGLP
jgi:DNA-binding NarL/FixJ family response regulator